MKNITASRATSSRLWRSVGLFAGGGEIDEHDELLDIITGTAVPTLREAFGIGPDAAAEMMNVAGDNPTRIRSEAAFAKLCGAPARSPPHPASPTGIGFYRGGHRQANAALYRIVLVRMRWHQPTIDYVRRRTAEGLSKRDVIRCLNETGRRGREQYADTGGFTLRKLAAYPRQKELAAAHSSAADRGCCLAPQHRCGYRLSDRPGSSILLLRAAVQRPAGLESAPLLRLQPLELAPNSRRRALLDVATDGIDNAK